MLFAYVVFFFPGCFVVGYFVSVEVVADRISRIAILPSLPSLFEYFFSSLAAILSLTQVTVIRNQCVPKAGFGAV